MLLRGKSHQRETRGISDDRRGNLADQRAVGIGARFAEGGAEPRSVHKPVGELEDRETTAAARMGNRADR